MKWHGRVNWTLLSAVMKKYAGPCIFFHAEQKIIRYWLVNLVWVKQPLQKVLAHRIVNGDVPENLKSKIIYALDMGQLIAGAKYKGEFEESLKSVVKEVGAAMVRSFCSLMKFIRWWAQAAVKALWMPPIS